MIFSSSSKFTEKVQNSFQFLWSVYRLHCEKPGDKSSFSILILKCWQNKKGRILFEMQQNFAFSSAGSWEKKGTIWFMENKYSPFLILSALYMDEKSREYFTVTQFTAKFVVIPTKFLSNKKGRIFVCDAPKCSLFFSAASWRKGKILSHLKQIFGPSYFVSALHGWKNQEDILP